MGEVLWGKTIIAVKFEQKIKSFKFIFLKILIEDRGKKGKNCKEK